MCRRSTAPMWTALRCGRPTAPVQAMAHRCGFASTARSSCAAMRPRSRLRRPAAPGQFVSYAGSDIARGEVVLRRGTRLGSREIGMLAACGIAAVEVVRKPRVAVISTGDELVAPGEVLRPAAVYDSNGAIIAAAVAEAGGEPVAHGVV